MDSNPVSPLSGGPPPMRPGGRERRRREQRAFTLPRPGSDESEAEDPTTLAPQPRRQNPATGNAASPSTNGPSHRIADPLSAAVEEAGRHIDVRG